MRQRAPPSRATVHRGLRMPLRANLGARAQVGRTSLHQAATDSPLFEPLRERVDRTLAVEATLSNELAELEGVDAAAKFGSGAHGDLDAESDIDLLAIGDPDRPMLARITEEAGSRAGREVNASVWTREELRVALARGDVFVNHVLQGEVIPLLGDIVEP